MQHALLAYLLTYSLTLHAVLLSVLWHLYVHLCVLAKAISVPLEHVMQLQLWLPNTHRLVLCISSFRISLLPASADVCTRSNQGVKSACPMLPFWQKSAFLFQQCWAKLPFENVSGSSFSLDRVYKVAHAHSTVTGPIAARSQTASSFSSGYEPTPRFHRAKQQQQ